MLAARPDIQEKSEWKMYNTAYNPVYTAGSDTSRKTIPFRKITTAVAPPDDEIREKNVFFFFCRVK